MKKTKATTSAAIDGNTMLADSFKNLHQKLNEAIDGTVAREGRLVMPFENCSVPVGFCTTPDGRKAQVIITVETNEWEWIEAE